MFQKLSPQQQSELTAFPGCSNLFLCLFGTIFWFDRLEVSLSAEHNDSQKKILNLRTPWLAQLPFHSTFPFINRTNPDRRKTQVEWRQIRIHQHRQYSLHVPLVHDHIYSIHPCL